MSNGFDIPPVPPIVNWIAVVCTIGTVAYFVGIFFWRRCLRDWWATRTKKRTLARFREIGIDFKRSNRLRRDTPALVSTATDCFIQFVLGVGLLIIGASLFGRDGFFITLAISILFLGRGFTIWFFGLMPLQLTPEAQADKLTSDLQKVLSRAEKIGVTTVDLANFAAKPATETSDQSPGTTSPSVAVGIASLIADDEAAARVARRMGLPESPHNLGIGSLETALTERELRENRDSED